jgi:FtsH-binding integral membrane protein
MSLLGIILLVFLVMLLLGALPTWNHSRSWGYFPSGGIGLLVVIVLVLVLMERI